MLQLGSGKSVYQASFQDDEKENLCPGKLVGLFHDTWAGWAWPGKRKEREQEGEEKEVVAEAEEEVVVVEAEEAEEAEDDGQTGFSF